MKGWLKRLDDWTNQHRPWALLGVVALTIAVVALLNWATGSDLFRQLFYPEYCDPKNPVKCDKLEWKELFQAAALILGLPIAFLLWHWRDRNVRDGIENARKDINLEEFQEVQLRAAGALDEKLPAEAREQLQIAALHQLREFLRGTYDDSFKRSAFELLLAGHAQAMRRIGLAERVARVVAKKGGGSNWHKVLTTEIAEARKSMTAVDHARLVILADEWHAIFKSGFPLNDRCFDLIDLPDRTLPSGCNFERSSFVGADLSRAHLECAVFRYAHLEGAILFGTRLDGARMEFAHLEGADLAMVHLQDATLRESFLQGAKMHSAQLQRTSLSGAQLQDANLENARLDRTKLFRAQLQGARLVGTSTDEDTELFQAVYDGSTEFADSWDSLTDDEKATGRESWIQRGMIPVENWQRLKAGK